MKYTSEYPLDYVAERDFDPALIAASTSKLCRFTGRCKFFYSVANHMTNTAYIAGRLMHWCFNKEKAQQSDSEWYAGRYKRATRFFRVSLMAHIHDSIEHLIGDIITPVKGKLMFDPCAVDSKYANYRTLAMWEKAMLMDTYKLHGIEPTLVELELVEMADKYALACEVRELMDYEHPCWQPLLDRYPPATMSDLIQITPSVPAFTFDEELWLAYYSDFYGKLKDREAMLVI